MSPFIYGEPVSSRQVSGGNFALSEKAEQLIRKAGL